MREYFITQASMTELVRNLGEDVRAFFRQEIELVKKETSQNFSQLGRAATILSAGGLIAGLGGLLVLESIGFLLAFEFWTGGLNALFAMFLGFLAIGLVVLIIGAAMSATGTKAISRDSLKPQRTPQTIKAVEIPSSAPAEAPSPATLHREALATKERIEEEQQELARRMTPSELKKSAIESIKQHPVPWASAALVLALSAVTGGYFAGRKYWRAWAQ